MVVLLWAWAAVGQSQSMTMVITRAVTRWRVMVDGFILTRPFDSLQNFGAQSPYGSDCAKGALSGRKMTSPAYLRMRI